MAINVGYSCTRFVFFSFNVLFWILGWGSVGVGVWLYVVKGAYGSLTPSNYGAMSAAGLLIAAGATAILIAFIGCCGAQQENRNMLRTYFIFVLLLFSVELVTGAMGLMYRDRVSDAVKRELKAHLNSTYISDTTTDPYGVKISWDKMQQEFRCCGVESYTDWFRSKRFPTNDFVPDSCCDLTHYPTDHFKSCGKLPDNKDHWFQQGCYKAFSDWLIEHMHIVGIIGLLFAFVEMFGLVSSMLLICGLRQREATFRHGGISGYRYHKQTALT